MKLKIQKLVHGGQAISTLQDGRKVFVWNALPGEEVEIRIIKNKKDYAEAIAENIIEPSRERVDPIEPDSYLATSPWQILDFAAENDHKKLIMSEAYSREKVEIPEYEFVSNSVDKSYGYRNKMEFGFWGDESGISLAHFVRGSHGKTKVVSSALADPAINTAAKELVVLINEASTGSRAFRAGDIKSVIFRVNQLGRVYMALFVKQKSFPKLKMPKSVRGMVVYFSNPKSPASVPTELLQQIGESTISDKLLNVNVNYDVLSFFQVNIPVFEKALTKIKHETEGYSVIDMYSGVGSIGVSLPNTKALVESDETNCRMAKINVGDREISVIHAPSEKALDCINNSDAIVVDPPRAGLHNDVVQRIVGEKPPLVVYLSCNPSTQARDIRIITESGYKIKFVEGYNFFPRTPHIESLVVLEYK